MDVARELAALPRTSPPSAELIQGTVTAKNADGLTVVLEGDTTAIEGVKWLSHVWPRLGQNVWLARFGRNLLVIGAQDTGPDRVRAFRSSNQTLTNTGQWYLTTYNDEADKVDGSAAGGQSIHSTSTNASRVFATIDGEYLMTVQAAFAASATGTGRLMVRKNSAGSDTGGSAVTPNAILVPFVNAAHNVASVTQRLTLLAGDYLEVFVQQSAAANHQVASGQFLSFLELRGLTAA